MARCCRARSLTKGVLGFNADAKARAFDPEKARQMLKDVGYDFNTPVPITTQNGKYVSDTDICQAIAGMLNKIGIKATVNIVEGGVFQQMSNAIKFGPLHMVGWYSLGDADFATVWYTKAGRRTNWNSEEYDKMFLAARSTNDEKERVRMYHEMQALAFKRESLHLPVRPAQHLRRDQEREGLRRRRRQGPAARPGRARQVTVVP